MLHHYLWMHGFCNNYFVYFQLFRDQPRSTVSIRGPGGYNNFDQNYRRSGRGYEQNRGTNVYNQRGGNRGGSSSGGFYNNYGNVSAPPPGGYPERDNRDRARDERVGRNRARSPPDRPLPYVRLVFLVQAATDFFVLFIQMITKRVADSLSCLFPYF